MKTMQRLRRTGRSTRMIDDAVRLAKEGLAVYVVADNQRDMNRLRHAAAGREPDLEKLGIKFETPETLAPFDWRLIRTPGAHENCVFLVDHHTIEDRFANIIQMLHRYD